MSDWSVGDLAVCVDDGPCACGGCYGVPVEGLVKGTVCTVLECSAEHLRYAPEGHRYPHILGWAGAYRFRKIRPDEHEACEPEFVTLLKRSRKSVSA